jgi:hypothetical protein
MDWGECGGGDIRHFLSKPGITTNIAAALANQSVFINAKGDVRASVGSDATIVGNLSSSSTGKRTGGTETLTDFKNNVAGDEYERIFCMSMPDAGNRFIQPIRSDMGRLYDAILQINCTGKIPEWMQEIINDANAASSPSGWNSGGDGNNMFETFGQNVGSAITNIPLGPVVGIISGAASAWNSAFGASKSSKTEYSAPFMQSGQCFVTETTTTTTTKGWAQGGGSSTSKSTKNILVEELKDHRTGRGLTIFDTGILQALQLD